jgi:capsular polysaccharide biosynthesis protein
MDLLSIIQTVWRHKFATIPVILLTAIGALYVIAIKAPVYQASSSLLLLGPPGQPTSEQIAANHKLAKIDPNNPYAGFNDLPIVADAVINIVTSPSEGNTLVRAGANPKYTITLSSDFGNPPILQITGTGTTPQQAILTTKLVTKASAAALYQMQKEQGVDNYYLITTTELVQPTQAQTVASGRLRTLVAVLGLGTILLFVVVSFAEALQKRRRVGVDSPAGTRMSGPRTREDRQGAGYRPEYGTQPSRDSSPEPQRQSKPFALSLGRLRK